MNVELTRDYRQTVVTQYLAEKHGKGPDDSEIFRSCRRWLNEYLGSNDAFIASEADLCCVFRAGASKGMKLNPDGIEFIVEILEVPAKRPASHELKIEGAFINRTYCVESVFDAIHGRVRLRDFTFSDSNSYKDVAYEVVGKQAVMIGGKGFGRTQLGPKLCCSLGR